MSNDKLNRDGVKALWDRVFDLIGIITGDVDVKNKGTLQEQVNKVSTRVEECFTSVSNGKKAVANAITGKGISTAEDAEFATMAENIGKIKSTPKLQSKSATLDTGTTSVTMKPDTGYDGLDQATAKIVLQEKSVTLGTSAQNITPDSGKLLSKVSIPAVPGNAALTNVLAGKTFSSATAGVGKTGTMANKAGTTVKASAVSQDDNNTYLTIPAAGYYDEKSKVYTENSNLSNYIKTEVLYNGAGGTVNLTIPTEFKNGTLIIQASHDNRHAYACSINGKTPVYTYRGTNYLQSYFGMDVDVFQLNGNTSLTVSVQCSGFTVTVIDKKVTPTYISTETSLSASKGEDYLCIYTRDYRNAMNVNVGAVSCSNLRSAFSSTEALYGVYGTWYCHNCATFCTIKDTAVTIGGDLVLWLKI